MMNLSKLFASKISTAGGLPPRSTGGQPVPFSFKSFARGSQGMQTRPPIIANKARGTMSSAAYRPMGGM
jgi:hypothetical protein